MKTALPAGIVDEVPVRRARCLDKARAAEYLGTSSNTVERLINAGILPIVKLPIQRTSTGLDPHGTSRRVLIDLDDLDELVERNKEVRGGTDIGRSSRPPDRFVVRRA